jgi:hypothetical protein
MQLARRRLGDELGMRSSPDAAGAAAVLDDHRHAKRLAEPRVDQADRDAGVATGRKARAGFAAAVRNASIGRGTRG